MLHLTLVLYSMPHLTLLLYSMPHLTLLLHVMPHLTWFLYIMHHLTFFLYSMLCIWLFLLQFAIFHGFFYSMLYISRFFSTVCYISRVFFSTECYIWPLVLFYPRFLSVKYITIDFSFCIVCCICLLHVTLLQKWAASNFCFLTTRYMLLLAVHIGDSWGRLFVQYGTVSDYF